MNLPLPQFYLLLVILINFTNLTICKRKEKAYYKPNFSSEFRDDSLKDIEDPLSKTTTKNEDFSNKDDFYKSDFGQDEENNFDDDFDKEPPSYQKEPYNEDLSYKPNNFFNKKSNENEEYESPIFRPCPENQDYDSWPIVKSKPKKPNSDNNKKRTSDINNRKPNNYDSRNGDKPFKFKSDYKTVKFNYGNKREYDDAIKFDYNNEEPQKDYLTLKLNCYDKEHTCTPQAKCPLTRFEDLDSIQKCTLPGKQEFAICCPPPEYPTPRGTLPNDLPITKKATKLIYPKKLKFNPDIIQNQFRSLKSNYDERVKYIKQIERKLISKNLSPYKNSPEMAHNNFFGYHKEAQRLGLKGEYSIYRAIDIAKKYLDSYTLNKSPNELVISPSTIIDFKLNETECQENIVCIVSKYRTPDGTCNNLFSPSFGKSFSPFNRVLNAKYGDGINSPRISKSKDPLPNPRILSVELTRHKNQQKSKLTLVAMQFGQFVDHDIASAALTRTEQGTPISCCRPEIQEDPIHLKHPACFEISIPRNDPYFKRFNITCMNFVRSQSAPRADCRLAPREQMNQPTSFIDASQVYGTSLERQKELRAFSGGRLLSSLINKIEFLPAQTNGSCNVPGNEIQQCFKAGDLRVNENIDLTVMQTVFLREHNRLAEQLSRLNPIWNDERIYQEAKSIMTAILQNIVYKEFLPAILNRQTMKQFDLYPTEEGFTDKYDHKINPTLFNSFATSAYRLHPSIQGSLQLRNNKNQLIGKIALSTTFNNPTLLKQPGLYDALINGMTNQPMREINQYFTKEVTDRLFKPWNSSFGLDLFSLNVQRSRDHGIPGYPAWRKQCGLEKIKNWSDLDLVMPKKAANILKRHYQSVFDIDLYVAGILENHLPNSELGPTFSCLVAEQFRRLKYGDRFWFENFAQLNSFKEDQLAEIKKVTMARLFCDNGDNITHMQPHVFILPTYWWNKKVSCNNELIPRMDLTPWLMS